MPQMNNFQKRNHELIYSSDDDSNHSYTELGTNDDQHNQNGKKTRTVEEIGYYDPYLAAKHVAQSELDHRDVAQSELDHRDFESINRTCQIEQLHVDCENEEDNRGKSLEDVNLVPTEKQPEIIAQNNNVGKIVRVISGTGTGKTSTLVLLAEELVKRKENVLYLVFNNKSQLDAERRFQNSKGIPCKV